MNHTLKALTLISTLLAASLFATKAPETQEIRTMKEYEEVINSKKPAIIFFHASWCSACKMMKPRFDEVAQELKDKITFVKINIDSKALKSVIDKADIEAIPTFITHPKGIKKEGALPKKKFLAFAKSQLA